MKETVQDILNEMRKGNPWDERSHYADRIEAAMEPVVNGHIAICPTCGSQTSCWALNAQQAKGECHD